eukprot:1627799-Amphidinium_carterae.2
MGVSTDVLGECGRTDLEAAASVGNITYACNGCWHTPSCLCLSLCCKLCIDHAIAITKAYALESKTLKLRPCCFEHKEGSGTGGGEPACLPAVHRGTPRK